MAEDSERAALISRNLASTPNLQIHYTVDGQLLVQNDGNGSAHIIEVMYRYNGKCFITRSNHVQSNPESNVFKYILIPFSKMVGDLVYNEKRNKETIRGNLFILDNNTVLRSDHNVSILYYNNPLHPSPEISDNVYKAMSKLEISIKYCSDYDVCKYLGSFDYKDCADAD